MYKTTIATLLFSAAFSAMAQEKPRVYVSDSRSWEESGAFSGLRHGAGGATRGGDRPQTVEIMKTFSERCPGVVVTADKSKANYVVQLDHEGGKGLHRDNKIAVFQSNGDLLYAGSTRILGNAVKDGCAAMLSGAPVETASR